MIIEGKKYKKKLTCSGFFKSLWMAIVAVCIGVIGGGIGLALLGLLFIVTPIGGKISDFQQYLVTYPLIASTLFSFFSILALSIFRYRRDKVFRRKNRGKYLSANRVPVAYIFHSTLLSLGLFSLMEALLFFVQAAGNIFPEFPSYELILSEAAKNTPIFFVLSVLILLPVLSELLIRGCVMAELRVGTPAFLTVFLATLLSGLLMGHPVLMVVYFVIGLCFCIVYRILRNFYAMVFMHMVLNIGILVKYLFPEFLKPYAFYLQLAGVLAIGLGCISFLFILRYKKQADSMYQRIHVTTKKQII